jgi:hypothetical protein
LCRLTCYRRATWLLLLESGVFIFHITCVYLFYSCSTWWWPFRPKHVVWSNIRINRCCVWLDLTVIPIKAILLPQVFRQKHVLKRKRRIPSLGLRRFDVILSVIHAIFCTCRTQTTLKLSLRPLSTWPNQLCYYWVWKLCVEVIAIYKVVQIWPGLFVCKQVTVCPGHIWTTLYVAVLCFCSARMSAAFCDTSLVGEPFIFVVALHNAPGVWLMALSSCRDKKSDEDL